MTEPPIPAGTWEVDPRHSSVAFQVKHMGFAKVRGQFNVFAGRVEVGDDGVHASGTVDAGSVDTNEDKRDAHLRSPDFFDVANHPQLAFTATAIEAVDEDTLRITGELTMRGVTRAITLDAEVVGAGEGRGGERRVALEVTGELDRRDFDMRFNQALGGGNVLVSDRVKLMLDLEAVRRD